MLEFKPLAKEPLRNAQGHVIGYKETLCDCSKGEELARVVLYVPRLSERGTVVAYEERVKGGAVLLDLNGKRIGNRWVDLRSRGTNARNSGLTIVFRPQESERLAVAQLTIDEIKQHLQLQN
jgi:hypothetical protein